MRTGVGGVAKHHVGFPTIDNSASHGPFILIGQVQQEAIASCQKRCQKLVKHYSKILSGGRS